LEPAIFEHTLEYTLRKNKENWPRLSPRPHRRAPKARRFSIPVEIWPVLGYIA
jgi:hypothetical protein